jgi:hypothetical protein
MSCRLFLSACRDGLSCESTIALWTWRYGLAGRRGKRPQGEGTLKLAGATGRESATSCVTGIRHSSAESIPSASNDCAVRLRR